MEIVFMSAGIIVSIVLTLTGLLKLPFKNFKNAHAKAYKALFTTLSLFFSVGLAIINQLFILNKELLSVDFAILLCIVISGVFCGYGGVYEGLGLKDGVKKIFENIKKAVLVSKNDKLIKNIDKIDNVDEAIKILLEKKNQNQTEV